MYIWQRLINPVRVHSMKTTTETTRVTQVDPGPFKGQPLGPLKGPPGPFKGQPLGPLKGPPGPFKGQPLGPLKGPP